MLTCADILPLHIEPALRILVVTADTLKAETHITGAVIGTEARFTPLTQIDRNVRQIKPQKQLRSCFS